MDGEEEGSRVAIILSSPQLKEDFRAMEGDEEEEEEEEEKNLLKSGSFVRSKKVPFCVMLFLMSFFSAHACSFSSDLMRGSRIY